jgi:predicted NAD/FAD-binding protein
VRRTESGVELLTEGQEPERYDKVVIATHADDALKLLQDPSDAEISALGSWAYSSNRTVLHTDARVLGPQRRLWAAWNYHRRAAATLKSPVAITYYMNKLQRLRAHRDYFVTLNGNDQVDPATILYETVYTHPIYTPRSPDSQKALRKLNGNRNTFFCGAYMRYGFHEDAVWSALEVARLFDVEL